MPLLSTYKKALLAVMILLCSISKGQVGELYNAHLNEVFINDLFHLGMDSLITFEIQKNGDHKKVSSAFTSLSNTSISMTYQDTSENEGIDWSIQELLSQSYEDLLMKDGEIYAPKDFFHTERTAPLSLYSDELLFMSDRQMTFEDTLNPLSAWVDFSWINEGLDDQVPLDKEFDQSANKLSESNEYFINEWTYNEKK